MPFLLPPEPAEDFICVQIEIPNTQQDIRNFLGVLLDLGHWWNYERTGTNLGSLVATTWQETLANTLIGECVNCDDILDCIETNEAIQQAIAKYAGQSNIPSNQPEISANLAGQLINSPTGCDNDIIYGMTLQLVEFSDRLIRDFFEVVKATNLASENVGFLISAIPVVETLPIDELFELGYKLAEDMEVAYLSASTTLLKTEIACDLLCLAQDNDCVLTLEMVRDYFQEKADVVFDYTSPVTFFIDFIDGTFVSNAVYYGMNILFFQIFAFGGKFLEYLFTDYLKVINSMFNDPNSDWTIECATCPDTWSWDSDFTVEKNIWIASDGGFGDNADWNSGTGWTSVDIQTGTPSYSRILGLTTTEFTPTKITKISFNFNIEKGVSISTASCKIIIATDADDDTVIQNTTFTSTMDGDNQTMELTLNEPDIKSIICRIRSWTSSVNSGYAGSCKINSIHVEGEGFNPFV